MKKILTILLLSIFAISVIDASNIVTKQKKPAAISEFEQTIGPIRIVFQTVNCEEVKIKRERQSDMTNTNPFHIPEKVTGPDGNQYTIVGICDRARLSGNFSHCSIPRTVTYIGDNAFEFCDRLSSVYIWGDPEISTKAFFGCIKLKEIRCGSKKNKGKTFEVNKGKGKVTAY